MFLLLLFLLLLLLLLDNATLPVENEC
jgi:hypothetical protein